jgi:hypothetical protein
MIYLKNEERLKTIGDALTSMGGKIGKTSYKDSLGLRENIVTIIIEPCFSDMSYCKKMMNRFSLMTKKKVNIQWLLYCMVHNIGKCIPRIAEGIGG